MTEYMVQKEYRGFHIWIRKGTWDEHVFAEQNNWKELIIPENSVVLDLGGHIGAFALYAHLQGAGRIISVEPDPQNASLFRSNTVRIAHKVKFVRAAVVGDEDIKEINLFLNGGNNQATHTVLPTRGRDSIPVPAVSIVELLKRFNPSVVKIDIEYSEYEILNDILSYSPENFAVEFHLNKSGSRKKAKDFIERIEQEYVTKKTAKVGEKNWTTTGIYQRRKNANQPLG